MLIKVKNPVCNQSTYLSNKPLGAQESQENSPKPRVESNFRSLHSYLDQNNETVKTNIAHFLFITRTTRYYIISTLLLIIKQIHVNVCDQWQIQDFETGVADLTERYQNIQRQNYLSDSSVPFHNFKLKRPQRGGWLATQSTPPGSAPGDNVHDINLVTYLGSLNFIFMYFYS